MIIILELLVLLTNPGGERLSKTVKLPLMGS